MGFWKKARDEQQALLTENAHLRAQIKEYELQHEKLQKKQEALEKQIETLRHLESVWQNALLDHQKSREKYKALVSEAEELVIQLRERHTAKASNNENNGAKAAPDNIEE